LQDLADKDILEAVETETLLKPKGPKAKPKHTRAISEETKQKRSEHLTNLNKKRSDDCINNKELELQKKEATMKAKLDALEIKKKEIQERKKALKGQPVEPKQETKEQPKEQKKKSKKQVRVVVEQSSSDSEDYGNSSSSSSDDEPVIYIARNKKTKAKEQPITKAKEEPKVATIEKPTCLFKFV
jgi:hypothetical protein